MFDGLVSNFFAFFLERSNELLQGFNQQSFDLSSKHFAFAVFLTDLLELFVVIKEEGQVLEGNIDF